MDQPAQQPPHPLGKPVTPELPHLVVGDTRRGIFGTLGIIALSVALLGIPLGIYLISQRTQASPQAAVSPATPEVVSGIFLESKLSLDSGEGVPVDVYIKSPIDAINLVDAKIKFDPTLLKVERIATGSGEFEEQSLFNKWIEVGFDNDQGDISIISGLATPGVRSQGAGGDKIYLATLHLKSQKPGTAILQVTSESQLLRNSDNNNIFITGNDVALNLVSTSIQASASASLKSDQSDKEPVIVITNPIPSSNYSYFKTMDINWSSFNASRISQINLYVNDEILGPIAQNLDAQDGQFVWNPSDTLALPYIQLSNSFRIEITAVSEDGKVTKVASGPFGILGTQDVQGSPPSSEVFSQNQLGITDVSRLLSNYLVLPLKDLSLDLNKDEVVNELDLFLIRQNLLQRGVIK